VKSFLRILAVIGALVLSGCGGGGGGSEESNAGSATESPFNVGAKAAESPVDEQLAEVGEGLFKTKTCSTCHAFGRRITGPDLAGVTQRRTEAWMEQQILHPDVMTKSDPISRDLLAKYVTQMPNLMLKQEEAKALIEYIKHKDHETSSATAATP
jgi:cytochrome c2